MTGKVGVVYWIVVWFTALTSVFAALLSIGAPDEVSTEHNPVPVASPWRRSPVQPCEDISREQQLATEVRQCARPLAPCLDDRDSAELTLTISPTGGLADVWVNNARVAATRCVRRQLQHMRFQHGDERTIVTVRVPVDDQEPPRLPPRPPRIPIPMVPHEPLPCVEWCGTGPPTCRVL